jgi:aspartyl-tRNA(Asn)/glutamyl-tRNA(Gln) amidotransferase subunit A
MSVQELAYLSLQDAGTRLRTRELSPVELLDAVLARTVALEPRLNAYITPMFDAARAAAQTAEAEIRAGAYRGPLHGIPIGLKDNYYTAGVRTTAGSTVLGDFVPAEDAYTVAKLRAAGAVLTGKLNLHEMTIGGTTDNPHYGRTHNPWSLDRTPGGSSGGSSAAVAAGLCYAATGSDTAGSIRIPAAYCGIVGLKPTYGRCSIAGIVPQSWSLDTAGPLARRVADAALVLQAMAGYNADDETSADRPVPDFGAELGQGIAGLRLGLPQGDYAELLEPEVATALDAAVAVLRGQGARVEPIDLPSASDLVRVVLFIANAEASAFNRPWLNADPAAYGVDVRTVLESGALLLASDYIHALRLRSSLAREVRQAMQGFDAVLTATTPTTALPFGLPTVRLGGRDVLTILAIIPITAPWNLSGLPTISVPCGFAGDGLPIGLQITGQAWEEARVLRIAEAYEQATAWHTRHPPL